MAPERYFLSPFLRLPGYRFVSLIDRYTPPNLSAQFVLLYPVKCSIISRLDYVHHTFTYCGIIKFCGHNISWISLPKKDISLTFYSVNFVICHWRGGGCEKDAISVFIRMLLKPFCFQSLYCRYHVHSEFNDMWMLGSADQWSSPKDKRTTKIEWFHSIEKKCRFDCKLLQLMLISTVS